MSTLSYDFAKEILDRAVRDGEPLTNIYVEAALDTVSSTESAKYRSRIQDAAKRASEAPPAVSSAPAARPQARKASPANNRLFGIAASTEAIRPKARPAKPISAANPRNDFLFGGRVQEATKPSDFLFGGK